MAAGNGFGFESGANNDALTTGNSGAGRVIITGGTAVISTTFAAHGTRSAKLTGTVTSGACYIGVTGLSTDDIALRAYLRFEELPSGNVAVMWVGNESSQLCDVAYQASTGRIRVEDDALGIAWTSSTSITTGTWYRFEFSVHRDPTAGTARIAVYAGDASSPISGLDSGVLTGLNTGAASITTLRIGPKPQTGTTTAVVYVDDWDYDPASTTFIGPYLEYLDTPDVSLGVVTSPTTIGGSNGKQQVTWGAVPDATAYSAYLAAGDSPTQEDFTLVASGVTSPYEFTGLTAGTYSYGIRAE